ncbi:MAG: hypothetical protein J7L07_03150 [Candidatus Odinarchaeota archaeon]|nr:hypothetical protein [Candidatus Odinarchaeota archaeon]
MLSRLREAQRLRLVKEDLFREEGGRARIKYRLTERGIKIINKFEKIKRRYEEIRNEIIRLNKIKKEKEEELEALIKVVFNDIS